MKSTPKPDELEFAINVGYGTDLIDENDAAFSDENRSVSEELHGKECLSTELKDLLINLLPFGSTMLLTKAVSPTIFKEAVMPGSLNVSTGLGAVLKLNQLLEKKGCPALSKEICEHILKISYVILMGGLYFMETDAISDFAEKKSAINTIGLFAVTGFIVFSGAKFPGVTYTPKQNLLIELGLNISSLGFLAKNILAGIEAKKDGDAIAWNAALCLMFASVGFILATAYEMHKARMARNTPENNTHSLFAEAHRRIQDDLPAVANNSAESAEAAR